MIMPEKGSLVGDLDQLIIQVYTAGYYLTGCREKAERLCALVFDKYDRPGLGTHENLVWPLFCHIFLQCCDEQEEIGGNTGSQSDLLPGAEAIQRALLELPPGERMAVILKYKAGMDGETIARCMDCSISRVSRLLAARKEKLRRKCFGQ
ncbi:RNA polymerase sigma factor [Desulfoscipio geothermicus]|nr:sigma-70 family RNA polymerase sigma factor [Desulfoscipio geothermicus]